MPSDLIIIGIDGASPDIIRELHDEGRLDNLSQLIDDGSFATLQSTHIPITPSAWTSMLTGKNPGKHGVFGFTELKDGRTKLVTATHSEDNVLDILSERYSVGYANVPASFPVQRNGVFELASILSPSIDTDGTAHPDSLVERLRELDYELDLTKTYTGSNEDELIDELHDHIETKTRLFNELEEANDTDVAMYTYMAVDWASHWFWKHMDDDHPQHEPGNDYQDTLKELYVAIDRSIGELVDDSDNVIIVSDHGFTSFERGLNLNPLLREMDMITPKRTPGSLLRYHLYRNGVTLARAYRLAKKLGLGDLASEAAQDTGFNPLRWLADRIFFSFDDLDWDETVAYSAGDFGPIYLTDDDDEAFQQIRDALLDLEDDGEQAIEQVWRSDEIYHGPYTDKAPDIVYQPRGWHYHATRFYEFGTNSIFSEPFDNKSGHHHPDGVFIAAGDAFEQRDGIELSIMDFAPTLLHALGEPVPGDMDGDVATSLLTTERDPERDEITGIDV
ncbi:MAG: alkaline phosphatase family protein [Candidatus Nanohaloarchaea archaeon]|nr:alkaline phosphatase family protein [Candidatus Nanohaloarchaea archaeon]